MISKILQILGLQPRISKLFSWSLKQFFLTVGQNNFGNKIPFLQLCNSLGHNTQIFEIKITSLTCQAYRWVKKKLQQHLAALIYYTSSADTSTIKMSAFKAPALLDLVLVGPTARRKINHILLTLHSAATCIYITFGAFIEVVNFSRPLIRVEKI